MFGKRGMQESFNNQARQKIMVFRSIYEDIRELMKSWYIFSVVRLLRKPNNPIDRGSIGSQSQEQ